MYDIITIFSWLNNNNYYIIIFTIPISFILCYKVRKYLKNHYNNNLLISNTSNNNLSTKLLSKKSKQPNDILNTISIESLNQEPPSYNEVI